MDSAVKAKWIQALRSGQYKKGRGALRPTRDTFCCLGVLCDLYAKETGLGRWSGNCSDFEFTAETEAGDTDRTSALLPFPVQLWAGLETTGGIAIDAGIPGEARHELPYCNDDKDLSFGQLADLIEKHA